MSHLIPRERGKSESTRFSGAERAGRDLILAPIHATRRNFRVHARVRTTLPTSLPLFYNGAVAPPAYPPPTRPPSHPVPVSLSVGAFPSVQGSESLLAASSILHLVIAALVLVALCVASAACCFCNYTVLLRKEQGVTRVHNLGRV